MALRPTSPVTEYLDSIKLSVDVHDQARHKRVLEAIKRAKGLVYFADLAKIIAEPPIQVAKDVQSLEKSGEVLLTRSTEGVTEIALTELGKQKLDYIG